MKLKVLVPIFLLVAIIIALTVFNLEKSPDIQKLDSQVSIDTIDKENIGVLSSGIVLETSNLQCANYLTDSINNPLWRRTKKESIYQFFEEMGSDDVDDSIIGAIGLYSSLGAQRARVLSTPELNNVSHYIYAKDGFELYSLTLTRAIEEAVKKHDYQLIRKLLLDGKIDKHKYLISNDKPVSILSYIYENNEDKGIAIKWMEDLIEEGSPITYWDLFSSNRYELPLHLIRKMFYASNLSPLTTFTINGHITSLANEALISQDYELSKFWLELDSPAGPDFFADTGLDLLAKSIDTFEQEQIIELFNLIAKQGILPNRKATNKELLAVISPLNFEKYYPSPDKYYLDNVNSSIKPAYNSLLDFYKELLRGALNGQEITYDCVKTLGQDLLLSLLDDNEDNTIDFAEYDSDVRPIKTAADRIDELTDDILIDVRKRLVNKEDIIKELSAYTDVAGKLAYERFNLALLSEEAARRYQDFENQENYEEINQVIKALIEQASTGNWDKALETALSLEQLGYQGLDELLTLSFHYNAPPAFIDRVLDRGANVPEGFVSALVSGNQVALARAIKDHLNINFVDRLGNTTLEHAIRRDSFDMFQFLIENGVNIHTSSSGLDALDVALRQFNLQGNSTTYLSTLMNAGFHIAPSHREIVQILKMSSPEAYTHIGNLYPQLL